MATSGLLEKWISEERFAAIEFGKSEDGSITANGVPPHVLILKKLEVIDKSICTLNERCTLELQPLSNLSPQPPTNSDIINLIQTSVAASIAAAMMTDLIRVTDIIFEVIAPVIIAK